MSNIHATAIVDPAARIDPTATIGPYAVIGPEVSIGARTTVGAHCDRGRTTIGEDNRIFQFASLGAQPQDKNMPVSRPNWSSATATPFASSAPSTPALCKTVRSRGWGRQLDHGLRAHCARLPGGEPDHLANNTTLAGHVDVGDWATVGGLTGVLQRMRIGAHTMIGFASHVGKDVPPFMVVDGNPLAVRGVNLVGLRRRAFSDERIAAIREMHKLLYRQGLTLEQARAAIMALPEKMPQARDDVALMDAFIAGSSAGIAR